jgi:hypothetical protein
VSAADAIRVLTGFDGSCPCDHGGVCREGDAIVLRPGYRLASGIDEEAPGKGSHFYTRLLNDSPAAQRVDVIADWQLPDRVLHHDLAHVRPESCSEWRMIPGRRDGARVHYDLSLDPGVTELSLYPGYNVERCTRFVHSLEQAGIAVSEYGRSRDDRPLWRVHLPSPGPQAHPLLVQARDHAYETAGSYAVDGAISWLTGEDPVARYLRQRFDITVLPMTNPDGVYRGMSRLTHERGANLDRVHTVPDAAHTALRREIDRVQPRAHLSFHNWTFKLVDGLLASDQGIIDRVVQHMPADHTHFKRWQTQSNADWLARQGMSEFPEAFQSWRVYVPQRFGGCAAVMEFPWFGLSEQAMRAKGARGLAAFALAALEHLGG